MYHIDFLESSWALCLLYIFTWSLVHWVWEHDEQKWKYFAVVGLFNRTPLCNFYTYIIRIHTYTYFFHHTIITQWTLLFYEIWNHFPYNGKHWSVFICSFFSYSELIQITQIGNGENVVFILLSLYNVMQCSLGYLAIICQEVYICWNPSYLSIEHNSCKNNNLRK